MTNKQLDTAIALVQGLMKDPWNGKLRLELTKLNNEIKGN